MLLLKARLLRIFEILFARILPGVLNVAALLWLATILVPEAYALFSLVIATGSFIVSALVGPIESTVVPRHSSYKADGRQSEFEQSVLGASLCVGLLLLLVGTPLVLTDTIQVEWLLFCISSACYRGSQPILRARMELWRYGFSSLTQSLANIVAISMIEVWGADADAAVMTAATGYCVGFVAAWAMCGRLRPCFPSSAVLRDVRVLGIAMAGSTFAENGVLLGTRYAILWFGSSAFLGVFSFAYDLAQRTVGVLVNIMSFAVVPRAYHRAATKEVSDLKRILFRGAKQALLGSAVCFLAVATIAQFDVVPGLSSPLFSTLAFFSTSVAIGVNRLKKMTTDPMLVHAGKAHRVLLGYAVTAPLSFCAVALVSMRGFEAATLVIFPSTYIFATVISLVVYTRQRR